VQVKRKLCTFQDGPGGVDAVQLNTKAVDTHSIQSHTMASVLHLIDVRVIKYLLVQFLPL